MKKSNSSAKMEFKTTHSATETNHQTPEPPLVGTGIIPRVLSRDQAAAYCGISPRAFSEWVRLGRIPQPIPGTCRWDLRAIDAALDSASGILNAGWPSPLDEWRAKRARTS
jgi:hypothetical protein